MVSKMWPTPGLKIILLIELNMYVKWSFFNRKNYNMWCSSRKCSRAPAVSALYKRFAPSNIFFTSLFADHTSFLKSSPGIASRILDANTELKKAAKWFQENRLSLNVSKTIEIEICTLPPTVVIYQ